MTLSLGTDLPACGRRSLRSAERGVTLIELITAVALFGITMLGVVPLFLGSMKSNYSGNEYTSVNMLARDRLEQLMNLPFLDPQLSPGVHANDLAAQLADPTDPTKLGTVRNPFTLTYQVTQWQVPDAGGSPLIVPSGSAFVPVRAVLAGNPYQYKRIDVTVQSATGPLGIGARLARVSAFLNNPAPGANLSVADTCAIGAAAPCP
jgi:prepilin-type N-terminal cleavage/methylation domain-containing protein